MQIVVLDDGALRFVRLDGTSIDSSIPHQSGTWTQLTLDYAERGIHINAQTAATLWRGERCDYGLGVETLLSQARNAQDASAVTERESRVNTPAWLQKFRELEAAKCAKEIARQEAEGAEACATGSRSIDRWREAVAFVTTI